MSGRNVFTLLLLLLMAVLIVYSFEYGWTAQSIPLVVGVVVLVMALLQLLSDSFSSFGKHLPFIKQTGVLMEDKMQQQFEDGNVIAPENTEEDYEWPKVFTVFLWLIGFVILLAFTSYWIAVPLFLFFFLRLAGKAKASVSFGISLGIGLFMFILFDVILGARF